MTAAELRQHWMDLESERALAAAAGLGDDEALMDALEEACLACRQAYVGAAVTEIATFRAQLIGPQQG